MQNSWSYKSGQRVHQCGRLLLTKMLMFGLGLNGGNFQILGPRSHLGALTGVKFRVAKRAHVPLGHAKFTRIAATVGTPSPG